MKFTRPLLLSVILLAGSAVCAPAQENRDPNPPRRGGPGGGNPEEFRQRMADRLKGSLKVNDEEWSVLQPLIEKVQTKQRETMMGGGRGGPGGWGGRGGGRPGGGERPAPAAGSPEAPAAQGGGDRPGGGGRGGRGGGSTEAQALRTALENDATSPEELKAKLAALREQRKKAAAELVQAREELRKVVTVRQEATLVFIGLLE